MKVEVGLLEKRKGSEAVGEDKKGQRGEYDQNVFYMYICMKMSRDPLFCRIHAHNEKQTPPCINKAKRARHGGAHT